MTLVIDASVALKWYLDEPHAEEARAILASDELLVAPEIIIAEVANAAWLRLNKGDIAVDQARALLAELPGAFLALVPAAALVVRALEIATELRHPVYDALYLATSESWNAPLVTADARLLAKSAASRWANQVRALGGVPGENRNA
jgi:predicted nucleic acid-binding protein